MDDEIRQRYERIRLPDLLAQHRGLRIVPSADDGLILRGRLPFEATGPAGETIADDYAVEIRFPAGVPRELPTARETEGRIPRDYHKLVGDHLCVGAPTALCIRMTLSPTLPTFVNEFVIPYLYGYSFYERHGTFPFGELPHGSEGIRQHLAELFTAPGCEHPEELLRLASMRRREANKRPCPCGKGKRLGKCHNRPVNRLRRQLGRAWFRNEYLEVAVLLGVLVPAPDHSLVSPPSLTPAARTAAATGIWTRHVGRRSRYVKTAFA